MEDFKDICRMCGAEKRSMTTQSSSSSTQLFCQGFSKTSRVGVLALCVYMVGLLLYYLATSNHITLEWLISTSSTKDTLFNITNDITYKSFFANPPMRKITAADRLSTEEEISPTEEISRANKPSRTIDLRPVYRTKPEELHNLTWMDTSEGKMASNYGDGTCKNRYNYPRLKYILEWWKKLAARNNITWFLTYGALIGAWRNGQLIPYDTDMDIHIDSKDNIKLEQIASRRTFNTRSNDIHLVLDMDWRIRPVKNRRRITCNGKNQGRDSCTFNGPLARVIKGYEIYLDIWDLDHINGKVHDRARASHYYDMKDLYPLQRCMYMGMEVYCPRRPRAVFSWLYGQDMRSKKVCVNGNWRRSSISDLTDNRNWHG